MVSERRGHYRCKVDRDEMFVMGCHANHVAIVSDISEGGLKFEYMWGHFSEDWWTKINVLQADTRRVLVSAASCEIVYNIRNLVEDDTFTGAEICHCGLKFIKMTVEQKSLLRQIMKSRYSPDKKPQNGFPLPPHGSTSFK